MLDVKAIRKKLGISQGALADRIGVDQATISRFERGLLEPKGPAKKLLEQLDVERAKEQVPGVPSRTLEAAANDPAAENAPVKAVA